MSLTARIIWSFALIVAVGFAYFLSRLRADVEKQHLQAVEEPLVDIAHLLAAWVESDLESDLEGDRIDTEGLRRAVANAQDRSFHAQIYSLLKEKLILRVYVTDRGGVVLFDSEGGEWEGENFLRYRDVSRTLQGQYGARSSRIDPDDPRHSMMFVGAPIYAGEDREVVGVLTVGKPQESVSLFVHETRNRILGVGTLVAVGIIAITALWFQWLTKPIRALIAYAQATGRGEQPALPPLGRGEIASLGHAFEEMRESLEEKNDVEKYVQALTHEMKSPLSAIGGAAELLGEDLPSEQRAKFLGNIRDEVDRSRDIVDRLLEWASLEKRRKNIAPTEVDLSGLLREMARGSEAIVAQRSLRLSLDLEEPCLVWGDALALRLALSNLWKNALDFAPDDSEIVVHLARRGDLVEVTFIDQGPGIPLYARERVFERFYSLKHQVTGRKGAGLGLCFVREVAHLHRGEVKLECPGEGGVVAKLVVATDLRA